jgi:hypothetical protein
MSQSPGSGFSRTESVTGTKFGTSFWADTAAVSSRTTRAVIAREPDVIDPKAAGLL